MKGRPKTLLVYRSLGESLSIGWERDDAPGLVHVFAQAVPGAAFSVDAHWPCSVCSSHNYTEEEFRLQIGPALERGPAK